MLKKKPLHGELWFECPFCEAVHCYPSCKDCEKCGWNPEVAAERLKKIARNASKKTQEQS